MRPVKGHDYFFMVGDVRPPVCEALNVTQSVKWHDRGEKVDPSNRIEPRSSGESMRRFTAMTAVVAFLAAAPLASGAAPLPSSGRVSGDQARAAHSSSSLPAGYQDVSLPNGESSVNVCSYAVPAGTAHCDAEVRSDESALTEQPVGGWAPSSDTPSDSSSATIGDDGAYSPAYLQSAYNIASAERRVNGGGAGQIVGIVDAYDDPNLAGDLAEYRSFFGLSACTDGTVSTSSTGCVFEKVNESGETSHLPSPNSSWALETSLDVEMVSAICPSCQILVVEANSATTADLGTSVNTAVTIGADVVSNSYGGSEYSTENADSTSYYDHPGVPIVVASGDDGYGVEFPAASPDVVAVGGTSLTQNTDTGTRDGSETVWNGAGAGCSTDEAKPSWQHDTGCAKRTVADVSADADPSTGVWVYDTYDNSDSTELGGVPDFTIVGGTSVATPIVSSMFALAGNSLGSSAYPASYLYNDPDALYPVTSGSDGSCGTYLCNAADSQNGYNGPTGLGTPGGSPNSVAAFSASSAPVPRRSTQPRPAMPR